jgi:hypothetical protein
MKDTNETRGRKIKGAAFEGTELVGVGGVKVSGTDYQTIKDFLFEAGKKNGSGRIPLSRFASNVLTVIADDIRNGKPMKRYVEK